MKKALYKLVLYALVCSMLFAIVPVAAEETGTEYPEITVRQDEAGTFVMMDGDIICELEKNRYLRFRATNVDDNWVGCERKGADLCIAFADKGVTGIVVENAEFTNNAEEGYFEVNVSGYKDGLDCYINYSVKGTWVPEIGKFKYTYETDMDADLEKWYANSVTASGYYNQNPNAKAPIEITDYHIEHIATTDIVQSETYKDMPLRYEWFLASDDGSEWEKFPKVHLPYPVRTGDYITIRERGARLAAGTKFGFTDKEHGGWMSTVNRTSVDGINFELCWYFFDVHILMYNAVPPRYSADRFTLDFSIDFDPLSKEEGNALVEEATERNWRDYEEYALPLLSRNNTFDTLITDIDSEHTCESHLWWASSFDCFRDDTVGYDDNYSVTIKRDKADAQPHAWNTFGWGYPFEEESIKKHKFRFSAMVKTQDVTGMARLAFAVQKSGADLYYGVNTHLADGTPREDIISWQFSDGLTGTNDWTPLSMEFTVNGVINSLVLEQSGSGQSWFDNVVIEDLGEVTADTYVVYDDFENGAMSDWTTNRGTIYNKDGKLVIDSGDGQMGGQLQAKKTVFNYGGRWIVEMDATINASRGAVLASTNVFNIEMNGKTLQAKTSKPGFTETEYTNFETDYQLGTPITLKAVMDFDTKEFELYYQGERVDLGEGNYIRKESVTALQPFLVLINDGYAGTVDIDRFMVYPATDAGAVNISRENLKLDEREIYRNNIDLPKEGINGAEITWSTSDDSVIDKNGEIKRGDSVKEAVLTATITKGDAETKKEFTLRVAPYDGVTFNVDSLKTLEGSVKASVSVANDTANVYEKPQLILATYNEGRLKSISSKDIELDETLRKYDLEESHEGVIDRVNIYLWDEAEQKPVADDIQYNITAIPTVNFNKNYVQVNEAVGYEVFEEKGGIITPLDNGEYTLTCEGIAVDYEAKSVSFTNGGLKTVSISTENGISTSTILVNDANETVSVMGDAVFESDFEAEDALSTYFTATNGNYTIEDVDGVKMLATKSSSATADTLLFGPELTDYAIEMDYNMVRPIAAGANAIGVGMRAKSPNNRDSYRVAFMERSKFGTGTVLYNRLALGRANGSNIGDYWYYAKFSDEPITHERDTFYKMKASLCSGVMTLAIYDMQGNLVSQEKINTIDCDFNAAGVATSALEKGKTLIFFHGLYARISDIKLYEFEKISEVEITPSSQTIAAGDTISLEAYGVTENKSIKLDNTMVTYTVLSGFEINGNEAVATEAGKHTILAQYTDFAGNTKLGVIELIVE